MSTYFDVPQTPGGPSGQVPMTPGFDGLEGIADLFNLNLEEHEAAAGFMALAQAKPVVEIPPPPPKPAFYSSSSNSMSNQVNAFHALDRESREAKIEQWAFEDAHIVGKPYLRDEYDLTGQDQTFYMSRFTHHAAACKAKREAKELEAKRDEIKPPAPIRFKPNPPHRAGKGGNYPPPAAPAPKGPPPGAAAAAPKGQVVSALKPATWDGKPLRKRTAEDQVLLDQAKRGTKKHKSKKSKSVRRTEKLVKQYTEGDDGISMRLPTSTLKKTMKQIIEEELGGNTCKVFFTKEMMVAIQTWIEKQLYEDSQRAIFLLHTVAEKKILQAKHYKGVFGVRENKEIHPIPNRELKKLEE